MTLGRLKKRPQFLKVAAYGRKWVTPGVIVQVCPRRGKDDDGPRVGFTASRKVGNAVLRNRARRRLRAVAGKILAHLPGDIDYVLIARQATPTRPYHLLVEDLESALSRLGLLAHKSRPREREPRTTSR